MALGTEALRAQADGVTVPPQQKHTLLQWRSATNMSQLRALELPADGWTLPSRENSLCLW